VFGDISARKFAAVLLGTWALVLIPVAISLLHKRATHQLSPLDKQYLIFCNRLSRVGVDREPGETPDQLSYRARQIAPAMASRIDQITLMYNDLAYRLPADSRGGETDLLRQFTSAVARFRPRQGRMGRNKHSMARDTP
jgi:hypothetical protein